MSKVVAIKPKPKPLKEKEARNLVNQIYKAIYLLDEEMNKPSTVDRGKRIAKITNDLEFVTDCYASSELHIDWPEMDKIKGRQK